MLCCAVCLLCCAVLRGGCLCSDGDDLRRLLDSHGVDHSRARTPSELMQLVRIYVQPVDGRQMNTAALLEAQPATIPDGAPLFPIASGGAVPCFVRVCTEASWRQRLRCMCVCVRVCVHVSLRVLGCRG